MGNGISGANNASNSSGMKVVLVGDKEPGTNVVPVPVPILHATRIEVADGSTVFFSASDRSYDNRAVDAIRHAIETPKGAEGLTPDPRLVRLYEQRKRNELKELLESARDEINSYQSYCSNILYRYGTKKEDEDRLWNLLSKLETKIAEVTEEIAQNEV